MSFEGLLIDTATVLRRREAPPGEQRKDRFGQPTRDEVPTTVSWPCRLSTPSGSTQMMERSRDVVVAQAKLFMETDADIREDDVVTVTGPDGDVTVERAEIDFIKRVRDGDWPHHLEVMLNVQRESA